MIRPLRRSYVVLVSTFDILRARSITSPIPVETLALLLVFSPGFIIWSGFFVFPYVVDRVKGRQPKFSQHHWLAKRLSALPASDGLVVPRHRCAVHHATFVRLQRRTGTTGSLAESGGGGRLRLRVHRLSCIWRELHCRQADIWPEVAAVHLAWVGVGDRGNGDRRHLPDREGWSANLELR